MESKKFTVDNFRITFNVRSAIEILNKGGTNGETAMIATIENGKKILEGIGKGELFEENSEASFHSTILKELRINNILDKETDVMQAYQAYHTVRDMAEKYIKLQKEFQEQREVAKTGAEKSYQDSFNETIRDVRKNFGHMKGSEKLLAVGGILLAGVLLFNSDEAEHPNIKKIKDAVVGMAKIGGVALGANYIYKIFSGQTLLESATDWSHDTVAKKGFFSESFKTDAEKGEMLRKSVICLGDKDFLDLAKKYKEVKASGQTKMEIQGVENKDMTPEEIFTAMDVFDKKYPVEKLQKRLEKAQPPYTWSKAVLLMMMEDGTIKTPNGIVSDSIDFMKEKSTVAWNEFFATAEGFGVVDTIYFKIWGKKPDKNNPKENAQLDELREQLKKEKKTEKEFPEFVKENFTSTSQAHFKDMLDHPKRGQNPDVIFNEVKDDAVYIASKANFDIEEKSPEQAIRKMLDTAKENAKTFVKGKYPRIGDNFDRYIDPEQMKGVWITQGPSYTLFLRVYIPGSQEFERRSVLLPSSERVENPHEEIFAPEEGSERISYNLLKDWEQERIRIAFAVDSSEGQKLGGGDIGSICDWYTKHFTGKQKPRKEVMTALFEDEDLREQAIEETGIRGGLNGNIDLLHKMDADLTEIEKDAAKDFNTTWLDKVNPYRLWIKEPSDAYEPLMQQMRQDYGYKVRLAILGDSAAQQYFKDGDPGTFDTTKNADWINDLVKMYKTKCKKLVADYNSGNAKFPAEVEPTASPDVAPSVPAEEKKAA
jgi:hypothetical protein